MKIESVTRLAIYFVDNNRLHEIRHSQVFPESRYERLL